MKKIMFNDKYGLTQAVLKGRKTMTRRAIKEMTDRKYKKLPQVQEDCNDGSFLVFKDADDLEPIILYPKYKVGEVVAVAQPYKDIREEWGESGVSPLVAKAGYRNKMYVRADLMPHRIRITNVRVERLQDISEDDVYREGFAKQTVNNGWGNAAFHWEAMLVYYDSLGRTKELRSPNAIDAFAFLIDKVSGKGTWESNPWVFVYEFELER
ncbi:MAG: hypothetical protein ACSW8H_00085 [bacterium]